MLEGKRILFVDDEEELLDCHRNKFKFRETVSKVIPYYATNAMDAENIINKENLDLIYLDLSLGESGAPDGLDLLKKYSKNKNIIVVSGHEEYKDECLAIGAKGFLVKTTFDFNGMMEEGVKILNNGVK